MFGLSLGRMGNLGWRGKLASSSLNLNFVSSSQVLDPRITFTRASAGTRFNSAGTLVSMSNNEPRFDYDPVTLQPKGLLIEEQRTNSLRNSTMQGAVAGSPGTLPTNWAATSSGGSVTRTIVGTGTEDGIQYIDVRYQFSGAATVNIGPEASNVIAATVGQSWASSFYVSRIAGSDSNLSIRNTIAEFNSSNVFLTNSVSAFVPAAAGRLAAQRNTLVRTLSSSTVAFVSNTVQISASGAGDITLRIGLPQLEQGAFATSVIPTTTAAATRAADIATMTGTNFSSWYRQDEGTVFVEGLVSPNLGAFPTVLSISDGSVNNQISHYLFTSGFYANIRSGGVVQGDPGMSTSPVTGLPYKFAIALKLDDAQSAANGLVGSSDSSLLMPSNVNQMRIGASATGGAWGNTHIRRIAYYPRRLSNSELQAITA